MLMLAACCYLFTYISLSFARQKQSINVRGTKIRTKKSHEKWSKLTKKIKKNKKLNACNLVKSDKRGNSANKRQKCHTYTHTPSHIQTQVNIPTTPGNKAIKVKISE